MKFPNKMSVYATVRLTIKFADRFSEDRRRVDPASDFEMDFVEVPGQHTIVQSFSALTAPVSVRIERAHSTCDEYAITRKQIREAWRATAPRSSDDDRGGDRLRRRRRRH